MKQVFFIPISSDIDNEVNINQAIYKIGKESSVTWFTNLIKAVDDNKYMLVVDKEKSSGIEEPEIGVKVIRGSQNMYTTQEMINDALKEMEFNEQTFISISRPYEYMYILLFEYRACRHNPRVKIIPNPADPYNGSRKLTGYLQGLDKDDEWGLQPYDSCVLDPENIFMFFSEE